MKTNQQRHQRKGLGTGTLITFAAIVLLGYSQDVLPQGWTTNGGNTTTTDNVGIGTSSPAAKLDVNGNIQITGVGRRIQGDFLNSTIANRVMFQNATPNTPTVVGVIPNGAGTVSAFAAYNSSDPDNAGILVFLVSPSAVSFLAAKNGSGSYLPLVFNTNNAERMRVDTAGNVGIGTNNPQSLLDVNGNTNIAGNLNVTGNINSRYQDVAEWVPSSEQLPTGTVVVLDATKSNQVIASTASYDTRVAGVVSEQPGIALGERGTNKVLVATTGRVKVKVDATRAPIQVGDLLVTSDVAGVAMKSEPVNLGGVQIHRPGTLIGKALEPLAKGSGEILVLLSLQ